LISGWKRALHRNFAGLTGAAAGSFLLPALASSFHSQTQMLVCLVFLDYQVKEIPLTPICRFLQKPAFDPVPTLLPLSSSTWKSDHCGFHLHPDRFF
jgi:hypothetical protein